MMGLELFGFKGFSVLLVCISRVPMAEEQEKTLAQMWENNPMIRRRLRETGKLTVWKTPEVTGLPSVEAMTFNVVCLEQLAGWWTSKVTMPQAVPIDLVRKEAGNKPINQ